jgi:energy-coupling factor transporter ATP-binding protein EcfA2
MAFDQPAQRTTRKARIALEGPSGSGKTYTALRMATGLAAVEADGKIGLIDTEHETSQLYADEFTFYPDYMAAPYSPQRYIEKIRAAAAAKCTVLVVDSLSHAWMGSGGVLEQVDQLAGPKGDNRNAWKQMSPVQQQLIEAILSYPGHIIITMRTKDAYAQDPQNPKRKVKVGLAPVQRDGVDYEFDVVLAIDQDNTATVQKTRVRQVMPVGAEYPKPGEDEARRIAEWLGGGKPAQHAADTRVYRDDGAVGMIGPKGEKSWYWPQDVDQMIAKGWRCAERAPDPTPQPTTPASSAEPSPAPAESAGWCYRPITAGPCRRGECRWE